MDPRWPFVLAPAWKDWTPSPIIMTDPSTTIAEQCRQREKSAPSAVRAKVDKVISPFSVSKTPDDRPYTFANGRVIWQATNSGTSQVHTSVSEGIKVRNDTLILMGTLRVHRDAQPARL